MRQSPRKPRPHWDAGKVRALRRHLGATQQEMAEQMGIRQQTVSEWETGIYRPRGPSATLLSLIAEDAGFEYSVASEPSGPSGADPSAP